MSNNLPQIFLKLMYNLKENPNFSSANMNINQHYDQITHIIKLLKGICLNVRLFYGKELDT